MKAIATLGTAAFLCACVTPGSRPEDMSASGHEQRAAEEERIAASRGPGKDAEETRFREKLAEDHRRAARALREREARACAGLGERERAGEPFPPSRIIGIEGLDGAPARGGGKPGPRGALVRLRAIASETAESLQRRIGCTQARMALSGTDSSEALASPFAVPGATVRVSALPDGTVVEFQTADKRSADALLERLRRYASRR